MKYLVIGLGIYGANLARDLTDMGHEVVGADVEQSNVEAIKEYISTAYIIDSSDEQALAVLPLKGMDAVIVAIGENFGASVKTVAILTKMGVTNIFARAIDSLHEAILEGLHVARIIKPEQWAARNLVSEMELGSQVASLSVSADTYIMKFAAPAYFVGTKYSDLDMERRFKLTLIAATRSHESHNILGQSTVGQELLDLASDPSLTVEAGDEFTCHGHVKDFRSMMRKVTAL